MERRYKIIIGATVGGAALISGMIFVPALLKTNNAAPELDIVPKAMLHKMDMTGITIRIDVKLKNPTKADFKMKYPYFRLVYKGEPIGTSDSIDQDIGVPHLGEANFNNILFNFPLLSSLGIVLTLIKAVMAGQKVDMQLEVLTHVDPYWKYNDEEKIWKRLPNLGNASLIEIKKTYPVTLLKQKQLQQ